MAIRNHQSFGGFRPVDRFQLSQRPVPDFGAPFVIHSGSFFEDCRFFSSHLSIILLRDRKSRLDAIFAGTWIVGVSSA
jgi:hypothetical protein